VIVKARDDGLKAVLGGLDLVLADVQPHPGLLDLRRERVYHAPPGSLPPPDAQAHHRRIMAEGEAT
jgi:hypothetical protein